MDIVCIYALQSKSVSSWLLELETSKNYLDFDCNADSLRLITLLDSQ